MRKPRTRLEKKAHAEAIRAEQLRPKQYLVDLFGEKRPIPVKLPPVAPQLSQKALQEQAQKMNYSMVDARPVTEEKGTPGDALCVWCDRPDVKLGFSMCFAHFCICPDCVEKGLDEFANPGPMPIAECWCCTPARRRMLPKEERRTADLRVPVFVVGDHSFDICLECLVLAHQVLTKRELTLPTERDGSLALTRGKQDVKKSLLLNL